MPTRFVGLVVVLCAFSAATLPAAVTIEHQPVGCVIADKFPVLDARLEPASGVGRARIHFRPSGAPDWYSVPLKAEGGSFRAVLPKPKKSLKQLDYYVEATDSAFDSARTREYTAEVASGPAACKDRLVAAALGSAASVVVALPAGAVGLPVVPAGFSASGVTAAAGSAAGGSASTAGAGGGVSTKALVIGGVAAAGGGTIAAVAAGGSDKQDPREIDDDGDGFSEVQGDCNDADARVGPGGRVSASVAPLTSAARCGQSSFSTVSVNNLSCQSVTVTALELTRSDPNGLCNFQNERLPVAATAVGTGQTREVGRIGGGVPYCLGGPTPTAFTCIDRVTVVVQSSAGNLAAGTYEVPVQFDQACTFFCPSAPTGLRR